MKPIGSTNVTSSCLEFGFKGVIGNLLKIEVVACRRKWYACIYHCNAAVPKRVGVFQKAISIYQASEKCGVLDLKQSDFVPNLLFQRNRAKRIKR